MNQDNLTLVTYTHSNCKDVFKVYFKLIKKFFNPLHHIILSDYEIPEVRTIIYEENKLYSEEFVKGLKQIDTKWILYSQEDFLLYNLIDINKIVEYLNFLESHPEFSFIRLLKSGSTNGIQVSPTLYSIETDSEQLFSMQATIWKKEDLQEVYENAFIEKIRDESLFNNVCRFFQVRGLYHYDNEPQRGLCHFDSKVYPYIATAIVRGKWNNEYRKELEEVSNGEIDFNTRGWI